ncbi:MAG: SRPBCC family protein [Novosphingobium sp.]
MIETKQTITIDAPIAQVWTFASDINAWAKLMPGLQNCEIVDGDDSHWTLKVGVGALIRTVKVFVHVERWAGPDEVDFTYNLKGDPVNGSGIYRARSLGPSETEITLGIRVVGNGPMAPMWEAMGKPLLPKFARAFAEQFKAEVERTSVGEIQPVRSMTLLDRLLSWLRRLFGPKSAHTTSK